MPPQNRSKVPTGTILEGKFRVTKEIGRGGMAAVYEAENIDIGKRVAVKILAAELITSRVVRERFLREARAAAAIRSPHICDVYDSGMYDERPFLVMELLEGESLYDLLTHVRRLTPEMTLRIATHTCRGLAKAHDANVVHRDLKPENIFITQSEEGSLVAKILDFGLAKFYEPTGGDAAQARLTREGALFGTPAYMSPEQAKGQGEVDHRCDLWALACIVYECLTGHTVWNVDQGVAMILAQIAGAPIPRPSRLRPDLPAAFDDWFFKALDRDPDRRFATAREFAASLTQTLSPGAPPARDSMLQSQFEQRAVDELIQVDPIPSSAPPAAAPGFVMDAEQDLAAAPTGDASGDGGKRSLRRAMMALFGGAALLLSGYGIWFYTLHPPGADGAEEVQNRTPAEKEPYALQIGSAQEWLTKGNSKNAQTMFREAYKSAGSGIARSLMSHVEAAFESDAGRCVTSGLGRPRPFKLVDPVSRPTLAVGSSGPVVAWVDTHEDFRKRQGFAALLDASLRRVTPAFLITPEARAVRHPQLLKAGDRFAFIYWEAGDSPGVYARLLHSDGRIAAAAQRISAQKSHQFYPALARAEDGTFWAVWEEDFEGISEDLVARHLGTDLKPLSPPLRLTAFAPAGKKKSAAGRPDIALHAGHLYVVFSLERGTGRQMMLLRTRLSDPGLERGLSQKIWANKDPSVQPDRAVGTLKPVSSTTGKLAQPRIACSEQGCFVVWDDETAGALAAFVDPVKGELLWHREFASKGARPAIGTTGEATMLTWYEASRLKIAGITRDGIERGSTLAKVSGFQPYPAIVPGSEPGQWYISWRDYEAGHLEAFVVRARCK